MLGIHVGMSRGGFPTLSAHHRKWSRRRGRVESLRCNWCRRRRSHTRSRIRSRGRGRGRGCGRSRGRDRGRGRIAELQQQ